MTNEMGVPVGALPRGFVWGAVRAGIKASGNLDLAAAVVTGTGSANGIAAGAVMFTSNQVVAAPVTVGRRHLVASGGRVGALLVNAGNANCATGEPGIAGCVATCVAAAQAFGCIFDEVFPSSTGIIGVPFPAEKVVAAMPELKTAMGSGVRHAEAFARAIMTTDTRLKTASASFAVEDAEFSVTAEPSARIDVRIWGAAKGAGMIHPRLGAPVSAPATPPHATMLVYLFTDLAADVADLNAALPAAAVEPSLQRPLHRR